ncbi:MAG: 30S ribosomal protein S12 methylthiotransferase RimO [wastewater metagenome]|nr:30S ribosomal protein S12 methylthiotransferase RimO [Candidatus Loosdrechtia aerotolerans]
MRSKKVALINLGCPKNLVDGEEILGRVAGSGSTICQYPEDAEVLIINTCGFIDDSKKESIDTILKAARLKEDARCKKIIVTGCLAQRYPKELKEEIPEIDHVVGLKDFHKLTNLSRSTRKKEGITSLQCNDDWRNRIRLTPKHYAYLRISDGCDNRCSYCAIPGIRGKFISRTIGNILEEVHQMASEGVKEINIISQDTTSYGMDLYGKQKLHILLEKISKVKGIEWIRILYTHPGHFYPELIQVIASHDTICKYIDLPIQHINDVILKRMGRGGTHATIENLIHDLRNHIPRLFLRTSVIVGFPGETEEQFHELLDFIKTIQFERLGVFTYSKEDSTPAASFKDQVPKKVKERRLKEVMLAQQEITMKKHRDLIGCSIPVIMDERDEKTGCLVGRTYGDAPDVDSRVIIEENHLKIGDIKNMIIKNILGYDLIGTYKKWK